MSGDRYLAPARQFIRELRAPYGVYGVPGNWDSEPAKIFEGTGAVLLNDRSAEIEIRGIKVLVVGLSFGVAPKGNSVPPGSDHDLRILLHHSPDYLEEASRAGFHWYLAGHTHGGQVRVPGYGALITLSRFGKRFEAGLYSEQDTFLYVNRGLGLEGGYAPRIRLFCRPEVALLRVRARLGTE